MNLPQLKSLIPAELINPIASQTWLEELLKKIHPIFSNESEYLTLHFFKDGIPFKEGSAKLLESLLESGQSLTELPASFRITNLQLHSADVLKMVNVLNEEFQKTFTCNLYYTPGQERNCFNFHADYQITYVLQLLGSKEWLFPQVDDEKLLFYFKEAPDLKEITDPLKTKNILLSKYDQLYVPNSLVHSAQIKGNGPSLHLTFGSQEHTQDTLFDLFLKKAFKEKSFEDRAKMPVSEDDIVGLLEELKASIAATSTTEFAAEFSKKMFADNLKATKQGRFYKKSL